LITDFQPQRQLVEQTGKQTVNISFVRLGFNGVQVNQCTHSPLMPTYFPLLSTFYSVGVTSACYQQAESGRKYIGISGKWVRWFTLTRFNEAGMFKSSSILIYLRVEQSICAQGKGLMSRL